MCRWIDHVKARKAPSPAVPKVLVIGSSTGYGLASRITAAFGSGAATIRRLFRAPLRRRPPRHPGLVQHHRLHPRRPRRRPLRPQFQRRRLFRRHQAAGPRRHQGRPRPGRPRRLFPRLPAPHASRRTGVVHKSCLKPVGTVVHQQDRRHRQGHRQRPSPSTPPTNRDRRHRCRHGRRGLGAVDQRPRDAKLLAPGAQSVAYSYIGPEVTWADLQERHHRPRQKRPRARRPRHRRPAQAQRRRPRLHLRQQGPRHPGQLRHPRRPALHLDPLQDHEGRRHPRGLHRASPAALRHADVPRRQRPCSTNPAASASTTGRCAPRSRPPCAPDLAARHHRKSRRRDRHRRLPRPNFSSCSASAFPA
jgi:hypothetical protein